MAPSQRMALHQRRALHHRIASSPQRNPGPTLTHLCNCDAMGDDADMRGGGVVAAIDAHRRATPQPLQTRKDKPPHRDRQPLIHRLERLTRWEGRIAWCTGVCRLDLTRTLALCRAKELLAKGLRLD